MQKRVCAKMKKELNRPQIDNSVSPFLADAARVCRILITTLLNHSPSYAETTTRQCLEHLIMYIRASQHSHPDSKSSQFLLRQHPQDCPHIPKWFFFVQTGGAVQCIPKSHDSAEDSAAMSCEPIQGNTNPAMSGGMTAMCNYSGVMQMVRLNPTTYLWC